MSVQKYLARQEASFILVRDLLAKMVDACSCSDAQAAQALSTCLVQAGDAAPKWHEYGDASGATEITDEDGLRSANLMLVSLATDEDERIFDPVLDIVDAADTDPLGIHFGCCWAYRNDGFLTREIYALLRSCGIPLTDMDVVLGQDTADAQPDSQQPVAQSVPGRSAGESVLPAVPRSAPPTDILEPIAAALQTDPATADGQPSRARRTPLTPEEVRDIQRRCGDGEKNKDLAKMFGVSASYISRLTKDIPKPTKRHQNTLNIGRVWRVRS